MSLKTASLLLFIMMICLASGAFAIPVYFSSEIIDGPFEAVEMLDACPFDPETPVLEVIAVGIGRGTAIWSAAAGRTC